MLSIMLLKRAAAADAGDVLGQTLKTSGAAKTLGSLARKTVGGVLEVGGDLAEGLGANRGVGEAVVGGSVLGGGYIGTQKAKQKKDQWLWQHGFAG